MAKEITTSQTSLSGATLYAVIDRNGQRWNGTGYENVTLANWLNYAVTMAEVTGTGFFYADMPTALNTAGPLDVTVYKRAGGSAAATDPVVGVIPAAYWTGSAWVYPGALDTSSLTPTLASLLIRAYLVSTAVTVPATADVWYVAGLYNSIAYYRGIATGLFAWWNGVNWVVSAALGVNGASYWTAAAGASVVAGPYTAQGGAAGAPAFVGHGNSVWSSFQPDVTPPAVDAAGRVTVAPNGINSASYAAGTVLPRVTLVDTVTAYAGNTPQSGDVFAALRPFAGTAGTGRVTAVTSGGAFSVQFDAPYDGNAAALTDGSLYLSFTSGLNHWHSQKITGGTLADATHAALTFSTPFGQAPSVGDTFAVICN